ncbi:MAG: hypothetical protein M1269_06625 [Chloroflexi bacterium]|nr:hypothetical protein [Chloroflexota bacterium]
MSLPQQKEIKKVTIDARLFWAIIAVMAIVALCLFFYIGRESGRKEALNTAAVMPTPALYAPAPPVTPASQPLPQPVQSAPIQQSPPLQPAASPGQLQEISPGEIEAVRKYFEQVDQPLAIEEKGGTPMEFATAVMGELKSGDTSTLQNMASQFRKSYGMINAINAPPDCREHKKLLLESTQAGIQISEGLSSALKNSDQQALLTILPRAKDMEVNTKKARELEKEIKQKYGLQ